MKPFGGLALIALGAAGVLAYSHMSGATPTTPAKPGSEPAPVPPIAPPIPIPQTPGGHGVPISDLGCPIESSIPPEVMAIYNTVHQAATTAAQLGIAAPRDTWMQAAQQIQNAGYPLLADCLRAQAPHDPFEGFPPST